MFQVLKVTTEKFFVGSSRVSQRGVPRDRLPIAILLVHHPFVHRFKVDQYQAIASEPGIFEDFKNVKGEIPGDAGNHADSLRAAP